MSTIAEHLALIEMLRLAELNDAAHQESWLLMVTHWQELVAMIPEPEISAARAQTEQRIRDQHPAHAEARIEAWRVKRPATPPLMAAVPAQTEEEEEEVARLADKLKTWIDLNVGRAAEAEILSEDVNRLAALAHSPTVASPALVAEVGDDTKRLDWMEERRVSVIPEFEGPWDATVYGDDGEPHFIASGNTPRAAIDAAIAASPVVIAGEVKL